MREYNVGAVYINDNVYAGETNIPLLKGNQGYSISRVVKTSGTGTPGSYDTYTIYINTDPESIVGTFQVWNGTGNIGDMTKAEYDTDNDGIVDNAERVNNHTVDIDVPSNAKFTDTVYDDTAITNRVTTLENAGYITKSVSDLVNYYTKTETYTKQEVNTLVDTIPKFSIEVVNSLPVTDISTTTIYLVRDDSSTGDIYKEYIYVNNTWEILGTQRVDLSNYYTKQETYNKTEVDTAISQAGGNEVLIGDEEDITPQTKIIIEEIPEGSNIPYINSEIAIGSSNNSNIPVWFKQSKNIFIPTLTNNGVNIHVNAATVTLNNDEYSFVCSGSDMYFGQVKNNGANYTDDMGTLYSVTPGETIKILITGTGFNSIFITKYTNAKVSLGFDNIASNTTTFVVPENCYYITIRFGVRSATTGTTYTTKVMVAKTTEAISYEPYIAPSIIVDNREIYQKQEITTSIATADTTYVGNIEQNLITRVGQLVEFDFIFTTTGTWTSTTKMFTGLPKPNTTTKIRFVALKTNPEVPLRFQLNADGSIQNGWSNATISSGQIIEGHITYITID